MAAKCFLKYSLKLSPDFLHGHAPASSFFIWGLWGWSQPSKANEILAPGKVRLTWLLDQLLVPSREYFAGPLLFSFSVATLID